MCTAPPARRRRRAPPPPSTAVHAPRRAPPRRRHRRRPQRPASRPASRRWSTSDRVSIPAQRDDAALSQPVGPVSRRPVSRMIDPGRVHPGRLRALVGDAVVADHRRGEADDLPDVARIGDRLLVAAHRGREDGLAEGAAVRRDRLAAEDRSRPRARDSPLIRRVRDPAGGDRQPHFPRQRLAEKPGVRRPRAEPAVTDPPLRVRVEQNEIRGRALRDPRRLDPVRAGRPGRHPLEQRREGEQPRPDEVRVERGKGGLEPGHAERRLFERDVLLETGVWCVVGGDDTRSCRPAPPRRAPCGRPPRGAAGSSSGSRRVSGPPRR